MNKVALLIDNITDYGKFISYCIEYGFNVSRAYWDDRERGKRCFYLSYFDKRVYYDDISYFKSKGFIIRRPSFHLDSSSEYYEINNFDHIF